MKLDEMKEEAEKARKEEEERLKRIDSRLPSTYLPPCTSLTIRAPERLPNARPADILQQDDDMVDMLGIRYYLHPDGHIGAVEEY